MSLESYDFMKIDPNPSIVMVPVKLNPPNVFRSGPEQVRFRLLARIADILCAEPEQEGQGLSVVEARPGWPRIVRIESSEKLLEAH